MKLLLEKNAALKAEKEQVEAAHAASEAEAAAAGVAAREEKGRDLVRIYFGGADAVVGSALVLVSRSEQGGGEPRRTPSETRRSVAERVRAV